MCDAIYHGYDIPCIQSLMELGRDPPAPDPPAPESIVHVDHTYRNYSRSELADLFASGRTSNYTNNNGMLAHYNKASIHLNVSDTSTAINQWIIWIIL